MKVYLETYGCSMNQADSEIMAGFLKQAGFMIVDNPEKSDVNIINTCIVKLPSEHRMIYRIQKLAKLNKPLIVAGCMPKAEGDKVEKVSPKASMLGPSSIQKIVDVTSKTLKGERVVFLEDLKSPKVCLPKVRGNPIVNIIPIAEGCAWRKCSYCIVKFARGPLLSYPIELIVKEAEQGLREGCRELWICSQDNACYGSDIGVKLPDLLKAVASIEGRFFIRVGMMNPLHAKTITDRLIEAYKNPKVFKFLHLPIQSASLRILQLMNRGYSPSDVLKIIDSFRKVFPKLTLSTDVIVGFPYESDEDFEATLKFLKEIEPDIVNVSKFGPRPYTEASKMKLLPTKTVDERCREIVKLCKEISFKRNERWMKWIGEALIDEKGREGTWIGRNFAYKPIVVKSDDNLLGKFVDIEVTDITSTYLTGRLLASRP